MDPALAHLLGLDISDRNSPLRELNNIRRHSDIYAHHNDEGSGYSHDARRQGDVYAHMRRTLEAQTQEIAAHRISALSDYGSDESDICSPRHPRRRPPPENSLEAATAAALKHTTRQLKAATSTRDAAFSELAEERAEHEATLRALEEEREEREATNLLLQDVFEDLRALKARNAILEHSLATMLLEREHRRASGGGASEAAAATAPPEPAGFNMSNVKQAIEVAVKEAASLPAEERKKKIRALRLKWHPDKHEVLKEMANEVTKMINEAVEHHGGE